MGFVRCDRLQSRPVLLLDAFSKAPWPDNLPQRQNCAHVGNQIVGDLGSWGRGTRAPILGELAGPP
eukprot:3096930-Pyramimonas_sp.AAC.1